MSFSATFYRWPLRYFVPCMLLATALLLSFVNYQLEVYQQIPAARQKARLELQRTLHITANRLEYLLLHNDPNRIQYNVSELMAEYNTQEAWLANADGRIVAASRLEKIGQQAALPEWFNEEDDRQHIFEKGLELQGLQPLIIQRDNTALRPPRQGLLYMRQDLKSAIVATRRESLVRALRFTGYALSLSLLLWWYFHTSTYRRLKLISHAARHWSAGDFLQRLDIDGNDELAEVAQALNHMAEKIGADWQELEKNKQTILDSNAKLKTFQQALDAHATITKTDADGNIVYVNDKFCEITGFSRQELLGSNHRILKSGVHDNAFYKTMWATITSGKIWNGVVENKNKNGSHYWMKITIVPELDVQGRIIGYISIRTDITHSERLLAAMRALSEVPVAEQRTFQTIAKAISLGLGCRWAGVGLFKDDKIVLQGLWVDGQALETTYLPVLGTPCQLVLEQGKSLTVADNVTECYSSILLRQWGARSYRGEPLLDQDGHVIGVLFAIDDNPTSDLPSERALLQFLARRATQLMEQDQIAGQLRDSELRFRKLFEDSMQAMLLVEDGLCIDCNRAALSLFGMEVEQQLIHLSPVDVSPAIQPDGRHSDELANSYMKEALSAGHCLFEWEHLRMDGSLFLVEVMLTAIAYGDRQLIHAALNDITLRKQAERDVQEVARYTRRLIEASLDPLVVISPLGKITDVNQATEKATGLLREQLVGTDFCNYFTEPEKARTVYSQVFDDGKVLQYPLSLRHASGAVIDVLYNAALYYDGNGKVAGVFAAARDVTERKRLEAEQSRLQTQLQQAQKMEAIGQLTGGIAHDFNNILAAILGYTGLALDRFVPDKQSKLADYLHEVQSAGERARDLIAKMLAFSRGSKMGSGSVDAAVLIEEVVNTLRSVIPSTIEISLEQDAKIPNVMTDPVQLYQVLMNLAINARDAIGEKGQIQILTRFVDNPQQMTCSSCHKSISGKYVEIMLSDNGSGIPQENLKRIFEPFFTTKEVGKGTGMGLAMVHGIMHEHGGHVLVESQQGKGSRIRLLCKPVATEEITTSSSLEADLVKQLYSSGHLLVIDDEVSVGNMLGEVLNAYGYQTSVFSDSQQALEAFKADPDHYLLAITDQTMPKLSGAELSQELLTIRPELPIIMATGYSMHVDEPSAQQIGIKAFFQKPLQIEALLICIKRLLEEQAEALSATDSENTLIQNKSHQKHEEPSNEQ